MGAPAISTRPRPARSTRPAAKPGRAPAKPKTTARTRPAAAPKSRAATKPRAASASPRRVRASASPGIRGLTPVAAVGRTATAVVSLPDCGVVMGMTRSRVWIGVLGVLLGGIVALNVWGLSLTAAGSSTAVKIDEIQRENSVLRGRVANRLTNGRVEAAAADLGLSVPAAADIKYLTAGDNDARRAATRLAAGAIAFAEAIAPTTSEPLIDPLTADATTDPLAPVDAMVVPVDPEIPATDPVVTDPAATDPVVTEPVVEAPVEPVVEPEAPVADPSAGALAP